MSQNGTNDPKALKVDTSKPTYRRLVVMFDGTGSTRQTMTNVSRMFEAIDDSLPDSYKPIDGIKDSPPVKDPGQNPISTKIFQCGTCSQPTAKHEGGDDSEFYFRAGVPCGSCQQLVVEPALQPVQKVKYIIGVGTTGRRLVSQLTAQAVGYGLSDKIKEGYTWLCSHYRKKDEVFVFGFSRGAFAARSLVSLLDMCNGVLKKTPNPSKPVDREFDDKTGDDEEAKYLEFDLENVDDKKAIDTAYDYYRAHVEDEPEAKLNGVKELKEKKAKEANFKAKKQDFDDYLRAWKEPTKHKYAITQLSVSVKMLGVWDTVGALGIPKTGYSIIDNHSWSRSQYQFHDEGLSPIVQNAYHALALDERREAFNPTLWTTQTPKNQEVKQVWFVGSHSNVGGGADLDDTIDPDDLWQYSYVWMQRHAEKHGLRFYWNYESPATRQANSRTRRVSLRNTEHSLEEFALGLYEKYKKFTSWWSEKPYTFRETNPKLAMLHWSVVERIKVVEAIREEARKKGTKPLQDDYKPPSLFGNYNYDEFMATVNDEGTDEVTTGKWHIETDGVMACTQWRLEVVPALPEAMAATEEENGKDKKLE